MWAVIVGVAQWIWNGIQASVDVIVTALVWAWHALKAFGIAVWDVAKFTWNNVLKPIGRWLDRVYQRLKVFYEKVFAPIHRWLTRISKALRTIYNTYFAPVLSTIDATRKTLKLLELLNVQWAKKLDDALGRLEQKIAKPLLLAISWVNKLDDTIERYVLTVDRLFHRFTLLKSLRRDWAPVLNIQWNRMLRGFDVSGGVVRTGPPALAPMASHVETFQAVLDGRNDVAGVDVDGLLAEFEDALTG